jgi:small subunit ribosomal protein S8
MVIDPIADMLVRIKNAAAVGASTADIPFSKFKLELAKILAREGYLEKIKRREAERAIKVFLKPDAIHGVKRVSKPGRRIYVKVKEIKPVKQGYGIAIISTPKGLMTDKEAKKQGLGGELICEIW